MALTKVPESMQTPDAVSELVFANANGHGSTNTAIRKYTNKLTDTGSAMTHNFATDMATKGLEVTIAEAGIYAASVVDSRASAAGQLGLTKNSNQLTTTAGSITSAHILNVLSADTGNWVQCSATFSAQVGDIIRVHTNSALDDTGPVSRFRIIQVKKL